MSKHLTELLTAFDRCDVGDCNAQAYIRATLAAGVLLFCAHHGRQHELKLFPLAVEWTDETHKLIEQRSQGEHY